MVRRVRRFSSSDPPDTLPTGLQVPPYWMRRGTPLPAHAGMNRFVWDLHGAPLPGGARDYPVSATPRDTPGGPGGPARSPDPAPPGGSAGRAARAVGAARRLPGATFRGRRAFRAYAHAAHG